MVFPPPPPLVVPVAGVPVETPVEASLVVDFSVEAGSLILWTGLVETLPMLGTSSSAYSPASPSLQALLPVTTGRAQ